MIQGTYWACCVHAPKSTPRQRLATAIELAGMRMPRVPTTVVVRSETAAQLGDVEMFAVVGRDGVNADVFVFPVQEPVGGSTTWQRRNRVSAGARWARRGKRRALRSAGALAGSRPAAASRDSDTSEGSS